VLLLIAIGLTVSNGVWGAGAFDAGTLDAEKVQVGQWWRAITALTLHLDGEHLAGNLLIGAWFGHLLGRQLGPGHAWCLVLLGAGASNLIEASLLPAPYQAVGASTAVFTALGLACAYSWGTHTRWAQSWAARWTPLICGVLLLTWLGSGGNDSAGEVDVAAHAMGFTLGLLLGIAVARSRLQPLLARIPQWTTGLVALGGIAVAWSLALRTVT
jgi:membrane associated rhomboid family serine protease